MLYSKGISTGSILAKKKFLLYSICQRPSGFLTVTSGLSISIKPAKPALPIEHLSEQ